MPILDKGEMAEIRRDLDTALHENSGEVIFHVTDRYVGDPRITGMEIDIETVDGEELYENISRRPERFGSHSYDGRIKAKMPMDEVCLAPDEVALNFDIVDGVVGNLTPNVTKEKEDVYRADLDFNTPDGSESFRDGEYRSWIDDGEPVAMISAGFFGNTKNCKGFGGKYELKTSLRPYNMSELIPEQSEIEEALNHTI